MEEAAGCWGHGPGSCSGSGEGSGSALGVPSPKPSPDSAFRPVPGFPRAASRRKQELGGTQRVPSSGQAPSRPPGPPGKEPSSGMGAGRGTGGWSPEQRVEGADHSHCPCPVLTELWFRSTWLLAFCLPIQRMHSTPLWLAVRVIRPPVHIVRDRGDHPNPEARC